MMKVILALSAVAIGLLFWLIYGVELAPEGSLAGSRFAFLPTFNAACNSVSTLAIITGVLAIRGGNRQRHIQAMVVATAASTLFLLGYITHHALHGDTRFTGTGWARPVYFFILITHVVLSIAALPMVLSTLYLAATRQYARHRALARYTWPIWLYVSITGVLVWAFLRLWS